MPARIGEPVRGFLPYNRLRHAMGFTSGTKLGPYEILSSLGAGGMGEVYRARDTKLGRDVALKVLPAAVAGDAERMARFQREAQVLASLNHPNIASIYGLEESGSLRALVMELVEGPTLAERLSVASVSDRRTPVGTPPLQLDEALGIARQITEALEAAHERGIIHRDLKPANIKITPEGTVKVLDFGLAKALDTEDSASNISNSPTLTMAATQAGVILGTAAYMSPEQAKGKKADRRADIWSFGCVLYETLTGRQTFSGETVSDVLAAVLMKDPDWDAVPATTPAAMVRLLRRCLDKDLKQRLQAIGEARIAIEEYLANPSADGEAATVAIEVQPRGKWWRALATGLSGLAVGAVLAGLVIRNLAPGPPVSVHFSAVTNFSGVEAQPSLSPDGRSVAFASNREGQFDIWVGLVTGGRLLRITDDPNVEADPRWSPDGTQIAFARLNESGLWDIWEVPALGGPARRVIPNATEPGWSPDGHSIAYANLLTHTIWMANAAGGNARGITQPESGPDLQYQRQPAFSHDGRQVAFARRSNGPYAELAVADVATGKIRTLTDDGTLLLSPAWSADDRFIYFASSRGGTVNIWKTPSEGGQPQQITAGQGDDADLSLSSDGKRMVFSTYRQNINVGELDLESKSSDPKIKWLTSDAARGELAPVYSPDGRQIAYFSNQKGAEKEGIWVMNADGSNPVELVEDDYRSIFPRWNADGRALIFASVAGAHDHAVRSAAISGGPPQIITLESVGLHPDVDPQGRLVGGAQGRGVIYDPNNKQTKTLDECVGDFFRWSPDGSMIAYLAPPWSPNAGLWTYDFKSAPRQVFRGWSIGNVWSGPHELIFAEGQPDLRVRLWRVRPDGSRRERIPVTLPMVYTYSTLRPGDASASFDVSPDHRRLAVSALEQSEADIGMIENVR